MIKYLFHWREENEENQGCVLVNSLASKQEKNPEEMFIEQESIEGTTEAIEKELSAYLVRT